MTQPNTIATRFAKFPASYKALEDTGHIPKGAITDTVNWEELLAFFQAELLAIAEEIDKIQFNEGAIDTPQFIRNKANEILPTEEH